ncbi:MAG: hypothetical protein ACRCSN_07785, partial [Dermatophilaceae bacterium]
VWSEALVGVWVPLAAGVALSSTTRRPREPGCVASRSRAVGGTGSNVRHDPVPGAPHLAASPWPG